MCVAQRPQKISSTRLLGTAPARRLHLPRTRLRTLALRPHLCCIARQSFSRRCCKLAPARPRIAICCLCELSAGDAHGALTDWRARLAATKIRGRTAVRGVHHCSPVGVSPLSCGLPALSSVQDSLQHQPARTTSHSPHLCKLQILLRERALRVRSLCHSVRYRSVSQVPELRCIHLDPHITSATTLRPVTKPTHASPGYCMLLAVAVVPIAILLAGNRPLVLSRMINENQK
ncbi:hypothetical protein BKA63DRAFT_209982 [Paraphoma chrysanthemicola]|nr:hypothetical protein BKA63DRAFT_209982 [Paraphoma chrysanthemicola]